MVYIKNKCTYVTVCVRLCEPFVHRNTAIHMHAYAHESIHTIIMRTYRLTVIRAYIRVNTCSSFIHTYVLRHSQTCAYTHTHTHTHTLIHTYTHTHTRARAHTCTYRYHTLVQIILSIIAKEKCDYDNRASSYLFWTKLNF